MENRIEMIKYSFIITIVFLCIIFIYILFDHRNKASGKLRSIDIIMLLLLIIVSSIKCNFGSDFFSYYNMYNNIAYNFQNMITEMIYQGNIQISFPILCYVSITLFDNSFAIFWVVSLIIYPATIKFYRKYTKNMSVSFGSFLLLGFFLISNNQLKQAIAMVILLYAYAALKEKAILKFIILVFFAGTFHVSAIAIGIVLYVSKWVRPTFLTLFTSTTIGLVFFMFYDKILSFLFAVFPIFSKYSRYLEDDMTRNLKETLGVFGSAIFYFVITLLLLNKKKYIRNESKFAYEILSLIIIAIPINIISTRIWVMNRIAIYLYQFIIIPIVIMFSAKFCVEEKRAYKYTFVALFIAWSFFFNIFYGENEYYTYEIQLISEPRPFSQ